MKTVITLLFLLPFALFSQQPEMSQKSQLDLAFIKRNVQSIKKGDKDLIRELPVMEINGHQYVSFIGKLRDGITTVSIPQGVIIGRGAGKVRSVRVRLDMLHRISELTQVHYLELAGKIQPTLDKIPFDTRVDSVHAGINLPHPYTGKNVIIGVNDWGFDYTSPMFYDTLLQNTRILAAWDQFKRSGIKPQGFNYGAEYSSPSDLLTAQSDTSNQLSYSTHATHVSGIAGGSGAGVISKGVAFESEFLFTTILVDEAAAIDSWYWMYEKAQGYGKRLVVNMSWGLYHFGTCDGTSLLSQAIGELTDLGVLFVSSAGNNGGVNFHFQRTFNNDSIKSRVAFFNYAQHDSLWGQSLHGWGEVGKNFEVKIQLRSTNNVFLGETAYFSTQMNGYDEGFVVVNTNDTVWYNISAQETHPQNLKPTVRFRVKNKNTNIWVELVVKATEGTIHFWNLVELSTNGGNWGMPFMSGGAGYISGDDKYGIGEPTAADDCITVASHSAAYLHSNGVTVVGGNRSAFSSIGPRNDGVLKPEISAPGSSVLSSISSFTDDTYTTEASVNFQGRTYDFGRLSGTSMSSPVVTGICALVWEVNPYLSPRQVKQIIIETARQDNRTGVIPPEGNVMWGYGKVNAMRAVNAALNFVGTEDIVTENEKKWDVFPNPATSTISINGFGMKENVQMIDVSGKSTQLDETKDTWSVTGYVPGIYVLRIVSNNKVYQKKVVVR